MEIDILGHHISTQGIEADTKKVNCVLNWPEPKSAMEVHSFLGLVQYIAAFLELFTLLHLFLLDSNWTPGILPDWTRTGTNFMLADHHTNFVSQS